MSRYIRQAGSSGGGATYGDSDVCTLLPSYTGALSSSDGTNICCIRNDWELICECNCIDTCHGTCVEYTFPSTADGCCIFSEYKLEVNGLHHNSTAGSCLIMRIGSADCYCTACSGMFRCMGPSASTNRFSWGVISSAMRNTAGSRNESMLFCEKNLARVILEGTERRVSIKPLC